eukprot:EG_transcript_22550
MLCRGSSCMDGVSYLWAYALSATLTCYYRARAAAAELLYADGIDALAAAPEVWILGQRFAPPGPEGDAEVYRSALLGALRSVPWFTYRSQFAAIPTSHLTCDSGWGCMVRTGQMLLAATLLRHCLGRSWRHDGEDAHPLYSEVMAAFCDVPAAPFSIHRICLAGQEHGALPVGRWFTPSLIAHVLQRLTHANRLALPGGPMCVYLGQHTTVYTTEVEALCCGAHSAADSVHSSAVRPSPQAGEELKGRSEAPAEAPAPPPPGG